VEIVQPGCDGVVRGAPAAADTLTQLHAWSVPMTMKELKAQLDELTDAVRQLAAHAEVLAVALRTPEAVPAADLDEAVAGIHELYGRLAER
jgi:hypothetical protein